MRVRELLRNKSSSVITIEPDADLGTAVRLLMQHGIGGLPVVTSVGSVVGFIAEREIVRSVDENPLGIRHIKAEQVMRRPAPTCQSSDSLHEVMVRMTRERLRHLVVLEGGRVAGVISVGDVVKHRLEQLETETGVLRDYVAARRV